MRLLSWSINLGMLLDEVVPGIPQDLVPFTWEAVGRHLDISVHCLLQDLVLR
jgi:hypothetical protein